MRCKARWVIQAPTPWGRRLGAVAGLLLAGPLFVAVAGAAPAQAQNASLTPIVVALPEGPSARTIGFYLAKAGGWFAREGLDPEFVVAGDPLDVLADRDADVAIEVMPRALKARSAGDDIVHVAQIFQKSGLLLACPQSVKEPKDLRGMIVSLWSGGQEGSFYAWMSKIGLGIYGEADGVTVLREGLNPEADRARTRTSDCFTSESYSLPAQLAGQGRTAFDVHIFSYEQVGTATLEDGVYARAADLKYPDRIERIAHFLAGARSGWESAADDARSAAEFLASTISSPAPDLSTLLRAIWATNDLVDIERTPFGRLDPAAYDRTVTILLTAAPDPLLKTAPLGAVSDAAIKALERLE